MYKPLYLFIGMRYMRAKRRNSFISFISLFTILGLLIGTSVLILVLSVMNGFAREINTRILGAIPHITMESRFSLDSWQKYADEVKASYGAQEAVPFVQLQAMLSSKGHSHAALISGIDPKYEKEITIIDDFMVEGRFDGLQPGEYGIVLGSILAASLQVGVGDDILMVIPQLTITPLGALPRLRKFTVLGIYSLGSEIDGNLALINIEDASIMKRLDGKAEGISLHLKDVFLAPAIGQVLARDYGKVFYIRDWTRSYGNLFASIQLEKRLVGLLLFLIIAVAGFNIVSTLVMLVNDKERDIAILRTMGASSHTITAIFMVNGAFSGLLGTLGGVILGIVLSLNISRIVEKIESVFQVDFLSADTYFIDYLPAQLLPSDVLIVCSTTLILSITASIYPARRAARIQPAESLRYE